MQDLSKRLFSTNLYFTTVTYDHLTDIENALVALRRKYRFSRFPRRNSFMRFSTQFEWLIFLLKTVFSFRRHRGQEEAREGGNPEGGGKEEETAGAFLPSFVFVYCNNARMLSFGQQCVICNILSTILSSLLRTFTWNHNLTKKRFDSVWPDLVKFRHFGKS